MIINNFELRVSRVNIDEAPKNYGVKVFTNEDCARLARTLIGDYAQEHFMVFLLNSKNEVLGYQIVAKGSIESCAIDLRVLFRAAIQVGASGIIAAHNHPSGDVFPSTIDLILTERLIRAGNLLGIPILDHVVVSAEDNTSLAELGYLKKVG